MEEHTMDEFELLRRLKDVASSRCGQNEPAHDLLHVLRVSAVGRQIAEREGASVTVVVGAALLHELFSYPKGDPRSHRSGEVCAVQAGEELSRLEAPEELSRAICYAISVHGFSAGITPDTLEAKVLQDADRLDAIGALGIARCFATCCQMGRPFYEPADPFCRTRIPDDRRYGVDHFYRKLLKIPERLHTETGRSMAVARVGFMQQYLVQLERELSCE